MFTLGIIGLVSAYILTVLLLLSINLYGGISWKLKAVSIVAATCFYVVTYLSIPPLLGWPSGGDLPARFRLVAAEVQQPDKQSGQKGAVFLWLKDLRDLSLTAKPRAYELPYSDHLHEQVIRAKSKMEKGLPQLGEFREPDGNAIEVENLNRFAQDSHNIDFYDLPDPLIPEK
ncbi:MAG: hypothetical protein ACR2P9_05545 [Gammaproteobacteria bacterium]